MKTKMLTPVLATFCAAFCTLLAGCVEPASDQTLSSFAAQGIMATVAGGGDDGYITFRLPNGKMEEFFHLDDGTVPQDVYRSKGRKCRIQIKSYMDTDPTGAPVLIRQITRFEWLEPYSSRFTSLWGDS